jgi:hypothetical protein
MSSSRSRGAQDDSQIKATAKPESGEVAAVSTVGAAALGFQGLMVEA